MPNGKCTSVLALILLWCARGLSAELVIDAPERVETGSLVVCEVSEPVGATISWMPIEPIELSYRVLDSVFVTSAGCQPGRMILICTAVDWEAKQLYQSRVIIQIGPGPQPKPDPEPDPDPDPQPQPGPRSIMIIYESAEVADDFASTCNTFRDWCKANGHAYYQSDDDVTTITGEQPAWLKAYLAVIARDKTTIPAIVISGDDWSRAFPMPSTSQGCITLVKELGG